MDDRRSGRRTRNYKAGNILLGSRKVPARCAMFRKPAHVFEVQTTYGILSMFKLVLPNHPTRSCKVVWLSDTKIGVEFE